MSHSDVEKLVRERSYELSRKLFQAHVDSRGPGEAAAPVRGADGVERDQERIHERGLTTIFGEIPCQTFRLWSRRGVVARPRSKSLTSLCRLQSHPAQYVSGIPSAAILLSISHPIRCSTRCLANVRARISGPMIAL